MSVLDQGDFSKLVSGGLKPLYAKKLEGWCQAVRARAENRLSMSLNTPAAAALLSSEAFTAMTLPTDVHTIVAPAIDY